MRRIFGKSGSIYSLASALLLLLLLAVIVFSPIFLSSIASHPEASWPFTGTDWSLASDAGQAYGGISAVLAGVALLSVAASLVFQARQTRIAQLQAVHEMQLELFTLAYDHPELAVAWAGGTVNADDSGWRQRTYQNLVFRYFSMSYQMKNMSDAQLERVAANRFKSSVGREYWESSRAAWKIDQQGSRGRRFTHIVERAYGKAIEYPPVSTASPPPIRQEGGENASLVAALERLPSPRGATMIGLGVGAGILGSKLVMALVLGRRGS